MTSGRRWNSGRSVSASAAEKPNQDFEPQTAAKEEAMQQGIRRGRPFGTPPWQQKTPAVHSFPRRVGRADARRAEEVVPTVKCVEEPTAPPNAG